MLNPQYRDTRALREIYSQAQPYPWIVMDDFLDPGILQVARAELDRFDHWHHDATDHVAGHQVNKFYTPSAEAHEVADSIRALRDHAPITFSVLSYLQSPEFRGWISEVTGISGLMSDRDWLGGGVHRVTPGGRLDVHADFNIHWRENLHRRLNLLVYLNPSWQPQWGGALEIWAPDLSRCCHQILPTFNRAVLFRITDDAYHGHPDPVISPDQDRMSLALYYYTQNRPESEKSPGHPVLWADTSGLDS